MRRTGRGIGRGRTGVVTVSTGEASLIADLAPRTGVDLPPIPGRAREAILADLPTMGYVGNPLDPWGAADPPVAYGACFRALAASDAYDVLVLVHDFPYRSLPSEVNTANEVTRQLLAATRDRPDILPVYVSLTSGEPPPETKEVLDSEGGGAPLLRGALEAFSAIALLARWERRRRERQHTGPWRESWPALAADRTTYGLETPARGAAARVRRALSEIESMELLGAAGLPVVREIRAATPEAAVEAAEGLGYPVVVKLDAAGHAHKSEIGGVRLGLADAVAVRAAAADLLALRLPDGATLRGLLVAPMIEGGVELIIGVERDAQFGPAVVVGLGGVLTEVLDDVALRLAPIPPSVAAEMLDGLRGVPLLHGFRGSPALDLDAVCELIVAIGRLAMTRPDVVELDLNPVIATAAGVTIVDALVVLDG
jgi:acyl-CoA synthetase (NDP forming)